MNIFFSEILIVVLIASFIVQRRNPQAQLIRKIQRELRESIKNKRKKTRQKTQLQRTLLPREKITIKSIGSPVHFNGRIINVSGNGRVTVDLQVSSGIGTYYVHFLGNTFATFSLPIPDAQALNLNQSYAFFGRFVDIEFDNIGKIYGSYSWVTLEFKNVVFDYKAVKSATLLPHYPVRLVRQLASHLLPHLKTNVTPLTKLSPELDSDSGLHKLEELVMIALCSLLSGIDDWEAMEDFANDHKSWFQSFLELPNGIPSHDTLSLILGRLNPVMFAQQLSGWMETLLSNLVETGSTLDKKALIAPSEDSPVPVIKAFIDDTPSPEKQPALSVKINSPTSIPAFLELLTLQDAIVMIDIPDSINYDKCQKMLTKAIVAKGGDYILAIKDHPPTLHKDITQGLDSLINQGKLADWKGNEQEEQGYLERRKKDQGRIHRRHYWFSDRIDWLESRREWANLNTLGRMEQSSRIRRKTNIDRRELLCSLKDLKAFSGVVKAHWRNENPHDWVLGIYFTDTGKHSSVLHHAAENIALLRQTSLNLLHRNGTGRQSVEQHHIKARLDDQYRQQLLTGIRISR